MSGTNRSVRVVAPGLPNQRSTSPASDVALPSSPVRWAKTTDAGTGKKRVGFQALPGPRPSCSRSQPIGHGPACVPSPAARLSPATSRCATWYTGPSAGRCWASPSQLRHHPSGRGRYTAGVEQSQPHPERGWHICRRSRCRRGPYSVAPTLCAACWPCCGRSATGGLPTITSTFL